MRPRSRAPARPDIVAKMKRQYEQWFEDVGHTRPDNYAPPRIVIGTRHENPVVLTRQDWRHVKGRPWGAESNGYWELHAAFSGRYDVRLRFPEAKQNGTATLEIAGREFSAEIPKGATEHTFKKLALRQGDLRLMATLAFGNETRGPWQVDVIWR